MIPITIIIIRQPQPPPEFSSGFSLEEACAEEFVGSFLISELALNETG